MKLVAVYGSLKRGKHNHSVLGDCYRYYGTGTTAPEYTMYDYGSFPGVTEGGSTPITVELFRVSEDVFKDLDALEGYPEFYNRKVVEISNITGGHTQLAKAEAWMYFNAEPLSETVVESGVW